jgi:hypothetical protein
VCPKRLPFLLVGDDSDECPFEEIAAETLSSPRHASHMPCFFAF